MAHPINLPLSLSVAIYNSRRWLRSLQVWRHEPLAAAPGTLQAQPLIMISSGRSGTTLLRSMLVGGGGIAIPPESHVLPYAALQYAATTDLSWDNRVRLIVSLFEAPSTFRAWETNLQPVYAQMRGLPPEQRSLARIIEAVFLHYRDQYFPDAVTWGDQSPNNAPHAGWIVRTFPQGRYLHMLRDGRDVVASYIEKGHTLEDAVQRWRVSVQQAARLERKLPASQFMRVRYEDLVAEPESSLQAIASFAGIPYSSDMLDYWKAPTTVEHRFYGKIHENLSRPVFTSSIGRWRERLSADQQRRIEQQLGPMLRAAGYNQDAGA